MFDPLALVWGPLRASIQVSLEGTDYIDWGLAAEVVFGAQQEGEDCGYRTFLWLLNRDKG